MSMRTATLMIATMAVTGMIAPSMVEAGERAGLHRKPHWRGAYGYSARIARISPPIVTVVTPDLSQPVMAYAFSRLDDSYDYPLGCGEYAVYGRWARDAYGRSDVARCRLVWLDGPRLRSLNRCY